MNHYLVVFDRPRGKVIRHNKFANQRLAMDARFSAERQHSGNSDIEVVVLGARSWEDVKKTHSRYFKDLRQLAS